MDYEKAYKSAKMRCEWQLANGLISEECATDLFRDIKESEDEKILNEIIEFLRCSFYVQDSGLDYEKIGNWVSYLEKQKENLIIADSIPSDCTSDAKCEDRWHKVTDSLPDDAREVLCKDAIGNFFIGRYYKCSDSWEVSMYDDVEKTNEDNPPVVMWTDIPSEKQKEQKPADRLTLENPLTGEKVCEREIPEFMKGQDPKDVEAIIHLTVKGWTFIAPGKEQKPTNSEKPKEWSEEDKQMLRAALYSINFADAHYQFDSKEYSSIQVVDWLLASLRKRVNVNLKPEERKWSEEDSRNYEFVEGAVRGAYGGEFKTKLIIWLKHLGLRSCWKPSEEQMAALLTAVGDEKRDGSDVAKELRTLYYDLKKLM